MSLRQHLADEAAREAIEQERKLKPMRDAEAAFQNTARQLAALERDRISQGKDDRFVAALPHAKMTTAEASAHNAAAACDFVESNPSYFASDGNQEKLTTYLFQNGCQIATKRDFENAFARLSEFGLLEVAPAPEPEPIAEPLPIEHEQEQHHPVDDGSEIGISLETGEPKRYSKWQIAAMDSDTYRRSFALRTVNRPGSSLR